MSSLSPATFCDVPVSTGFDGHASTSRVSLDWVLNSGLRTHNSQASGLLTLPCDVGVISMFLNNVPVTASLASDLVLGLDWFNFVLMALDLRRLPLLSTICATESGQSSSIATLAVAPLPVREVKHHGEVQRPGRPVRGVSKHLVREVTHPVRGVFTI
ncbi:hypothetical protein MVEN_01980000 [Mycena venus]|uniref:Uncharacterized protein n=1 Tax=Mycena venus TaxID=2733690 RepID=A0A8H6XDE3_9AGAR|nr:hypothetical protein MVEN_01980000 [Mycena venus]